jgi:hypothetical protein
MSGRRSVCECHREPTRGDGRCAVKDRETRRKWRAANREVVNAQKRRNRARRKSRPGDVE